MLLQHGRNRMLLFWVFKYGPSKSEIFLELNLRLINILLKGRSASLPPGMTMELMSKQMCNGYMYMILSNENPTEYPAMDGPMSGDIGSYSSSGGSCTIEVPMASFNGTHENIEETEVAIPKCDCSDPKKYVFYDEGRF